MVECSIWEILSSFRGFRRQFFFKPNPMLIRKVKSALEMLEEMFVVFATELGKKMD